MVRSLVLTAFFISFTWSTLYAQVKKPASLKKYDTIIKFRSPNIPGYFYWSIRKGEWGILNSKKQVIVPCQYEVPYVAEYDLLYGRQGADGMWINNPVVMCSNATFDLVDLKSGIIPGLAISGILRTGEGFVFEDTTGKWGFLDTLGRVSMKPLSEVRPYRINDTAFVVRMDSLFYVCDIYGTVLTGKEDSDSCAGLKLLAMLSGFDMRYLHADTAYLPYRKMFRALNFYFDNNDNENVEFSSIAELFESDQPVEYLSWYCSIDSDIRYVDEKFDDEEEDMEVDECYNEMVATRDEVYCEIKAISPEILEIKETFRMGNGWHSYWSTESYGYYRMREAGFDSLGLNDFFTGMDSMLLVSNNYLRSSIGTLEEETFEYLEKDSMRIVMDTDFWLHPEGIDFIFDYDAEAPEQYFFTIPYKVLAKFIPRDGLLHGMWELPAE